MDLPDDLLEPKLLQEMLLLETLYILGRLRPLRVSRE